MSSSRWKNLLDKRYIGTNDGFTAPLYGMPFTAVNRCPAETALTMGEAQGM